MTHRDESAQRYLEQAGLAQYFTDAVTAAQPFPRKPDPAALNYLLINTRSIATAPLWWVIATWTSRPVTMLGLPDIYLISTA